jgi:hypothetical protein
MAADILAQQLEKAATITALFHTGKPGGPTTLLLGLPWGGSFLLPTKSPSRSQGEKGASMIAFIA